ncbi:hypothetical protein GNI_115240 [Gregarina niphandrodes]|uniref:Uncharacterized protein n=1 Tax=Gregarina niphandrodes TaxID=110365 RepID=A0A023B2Z8_GRENI|nr:hypothetical protein GNI_115240 [Gregarina niphandrodes]EZG55295.1 hypothetical protein GNI_115240 [Gregarina niphandrodes]|eukprot:XP_011131674.1 hypothetical protein GNI_115240 [Gregarina niphandrodes]
MKFAGVVALYGVIVGGKVLRLLATDECKSRLLGCSLKKPLDCSVICEPGPALVESAVSAAAGAAILVPESPLDNNEPPVADENPSRRILSEAEAGVEAKFGAAEIGGVPAVAVAEAGELLRNEDEAKVGFEEVGSVPRVGGGDEPVWAASEAAAGVQGGGSEGGVGRCQNVCVDNRIQLCVLDNLCDEPIQLTEQWNITHFCLASNGHKGGWGFRLPLAVAVDPFRIQQLVFDSELFPATEPQHIVQDPTIELQVGVMIDNAPQYADSVMHSCLIEDNPGINTIATLANTQLTDGSRRIHFELNDPVFPTEKNIIKGETFLLTITAPAVTLANGGTIPPPLDKTLLTLVHTLG